MGWGSTFINGLSSDRVPRLRLVIGPSSSPAWGGPQPSSPIILTNYAESGSHEVLADECRTSGASLDPLFWRHNGSQLSVTFIGSDTLRTLLSADVVRGTVVELQAGWAGMTVASFETVWWGQIQQIQWVRGNVFRLIAWDGTTSYRAGLSSTGHNFFSSITASTTVAAGGYTAGGGVMNVASTTGFEKETGGKGLLLVDDGTNPPFFLTYTSTTATAFGGVTGNVYGTTDTTVASGATVTEYALIEDNPGNIVRKFLTSTGAGTNGAWDTLPSTWGAHIPSSYVDLSGIATWITSVYGSSGLWQVIQGETVNNGREWINDLLALGGIHIVMVEGQLSVRMAQDPTAAPTLTGPVDVTADMIAAHRGWEAFDPKLSAQFLSASTYRNGVEINLGSLPQALASLSRFYRRVTLEYPGRGSAVGTAFANAYMHPWQDVRNIDMSPVARDSSAVISSEHQRLGKWAMFVNERASLTLSDLRGARLACGDRIPYTDPFLFGYDESSGSGTYSEADAMVVAGPDVDWIRGTAGVDLLKCTSTRAP